MSRRTIRKNKTAQIIGAIGVATGNRPAKQISSPIRSPGRNPRDIPSLTKNATAIDRMQRSYASRYGLTIAAPTQTIAAFKAKGIGLAHNAQTVAATIVAIVNCTVQAIHVLVPAQ